MRRFYLAAAIAAAATFGPALATADDAHDQAMAQHIATALRESGQMQNYSVGVKYRDGTVWLNGRVTSREQLSTALALVSQIGGVQKIVNNLTVDRSSARAQPRASAPSTLNQRGVAQPQPHLASRGKRSPVQLAAALEAQGPMMGPGGSSVPMGYAQLDNPDSVSPPAAPPAPSSGTAATGNRPLPAYMPGGPAPMGPVAHDQPHMPNHAWPGYAAYPNYAAVTYPKQYSPTAWPYIGPFYPYPQVPLGWRKVSLEWDDGWWFLDFDDRGCY